MEFSNTDNHGFVETRFVGSVAGQSVCLQMVMDELWSDTEKQLTAWEQLYLMACVKTYFAQYWKETRGEWLEIDREGERYPDDF